MPEKVSGTGRCARRARIAVGGADRASSRRVGPSPGVPARTSRRRRSGRRAAGAGVVAAPEVPVARRAACAGVVAVSEAPVRSPSSRPRRGRRSPSSGVVGHHVPLGCVSRSPAEGAANPRARRGTGTCTWTLTAPGAGKPPQPPARAGAVELRRAGHGEVPRRSVARPASTDVCRPPRGGPAPEVGIRWSGVLERLAPRRHSPFVRAGRLRARAGAGARGGRRRGATAPLDQLGDPGPVVQRRAPPGRGHSPSRRAAPVRLGAAVPPPALTPPLP